MSYFLLSTIGIVVECGISTKLTIGNCSKHFYKIHSLSSVCESRCVASRTPMPLSATCAARFCASVNKCIQSSCRQPRPALFFSEDLCSFSHRREQQTSPQQSPPTALSSSTPYRDVSLWLLHNICRHLKCTQLLHKCR